MDAEKGMGRIGSVLCCYEVHADVTFAQSRDADSGMLDVFISVWTTCQERSCSYLESTGVPSPIN